VAGALAVVEAMLQAPQFLYRIEVERTGRAGVRVVTGHEMASRLSYLLWASTPDGELERAARDGSLDSAEGVAAQARRMLAVTARLQRASARFVRDWLALDNLRGVTRADLPAGMAQEMLESALAGVQDHLWTAGGPLAGVFESRPAWLTPALAAWIGIPRAMGTGLARYDLSARPERAGVLTHPGLLTVMSDSDNGGIVARGLFVLERLLCRHAVDPPPDLDTTAFLSHLGKEATLRQYSEDRIKNASCAACHAQFDPLAYAFEPFDGVGRYRKSNTYGRPLRSDGEIALDGATRPYRDAGELGKLFAGSADVARCLAEKGLQAGLGRLLETAEARVVDEVHRGFMAGGASYTALWLAVASHPVFRSLRTE
jgi:hypothetical protein